MINPSKEALINDLLNDNKTYFGLIRVYQEKIEKQKTKVLQLAYCSTFEHWEEALKSYADLLRMVALKRSFEKDILNNLKEIRRLRNAE